MPNFFNNSKPNFSSTPSYNMGYLSQLYRTISNSKNPMELFSQMAKNNPQFEPVMKALNSGTNPQQIFETMCKERGIDPNEFIRQLQGK